MAEYKRKKKEEPGAVALAATETGNRPPYAPEIEEAVIGAMMIEDECVFQAVENLTDRSFYDPKMRMVFQAISKLFRARSAVDMMTVTEQLREDGTLNDVGGAPVLASLTAKVGSAANMEFYVKILQQKTIQRDLIEVAYNILKGAFDPTYEVDRLIQESQNGVYDAVQGNMRSAYVGLGDALNRAMERIQRSQLATGLTGVPSGFPSLDAITMGWQEGNLIVIGARPGHGKTAIALNMARAAAVDHAIPTAFFTLEMTDVELADRIIATETGLSSGRRKGKVKMSEKEWEALEQGLARAAKAPLYIDETPGLTISEFTSKIKRMCLEKGIKIAFVDYLQLMHASGHESQYRAQEIGEISRQLKETAKELKIPIIALAQLNRNLVGRQGSVNGRPVLSDLKDSGSIEQDADMVLFIHRPALLGLSEMPDDFTELSIAKNRSGEMGIIELSFNGDLVKFTEFKQSLAERVGVKPSGSANPVPKGPSLPPMPQVSERAAGYDPFERYDGINDF